MGGYLLKREMGLAFLTDAMFTHLFPSGLTNGLIIELSPWNMISGSFGGKDTILQHFQHNLSPEINMQETPYASFTTEKKKGEDE